MHIETMSSSARLLASSVSSATLAVALGLRPAGAQAQDAGAAVPRAADGHPDHHGTWDNGSGIDFVRPKTLGESVCVRGCVDAAAAAPPQAESMQVRRKNAEALGERAAGMARVIPRT